MNILREAESLTSGDRNKDYGHPMDDFRRVATMWSALFGTRITPEQVPLAMICMKLSRQAHKPKRDNLVDIAGYARTLEMCEEHDDFHRGVEDEWSMGQEVTLNDK